MIITYKGMIFYVFPSQKAYYIPVCTNGDSIGFCLSELKKSMVQGDWKAFG
jgi:hypothetical protein